MTSRFTGMMPGDTTYEVDGLRQLWIYCRGDRDQLEHLVGHLPFGLQDDVFVLGMADFSAGPGWTDASVVLPITFEGRRGGTYCFEYEDQHTSVAMGREAWGYPKALARMTWDEDASGLHVRVDDYDTEVFEADVVLDDAVDDAAWSHLSIYPQYQVRAVPQKNGPGFDSMEVVSRDPSVDEIVQERHLGRARVDIGTVDIANRILGGRRLEVVDVLGAELRVSDYRSTSENGVPRTVQRLV
ncbi:acetoacetate decarboxylase family protein [Brachybacterium huguangmaarense]|uniref:Acetoacetate decarboxylase family protein n=1 Tax=Brachybacterium huguangmaarense TaxID=1652028 RepID=A0ABY6FYL9_9MICO|nr:acetoacetate decarboxylase family protein [Brachybacterium huguangmaarense]UYG16040.1 acetoacetate decarboxylase family protein [Brachybacterium huguangmaarense]